MQTIFLSAAHSCSNDNLYISLFRDNYDDKVYNILKNALCKYRHLGNDCILTDQIHYIYMLLSSYFYYITLKKVRYNEKSFEKDINILFKSCADIAQDWDCAELSELKLQRLELPELKINLHELKMKECHCNNLQELNIVHLNDYRVINNKLITKKQLNKLYFKHLKQIKKEQQLQQIKKDFLEFIQSLNSL